MRSLVRALAWLTVAAVVPACGSGSGDAAPPDLAQYFVAAPYADASCNVPDQRLAGQREVRLFVNGSSDLLGMSTGLARYYARHGLTFFTREPPHFVPMAYALDTNNDALVAALAKAFPTVDLNNEQAIIADPALWNRIMTFVANFELRPLIDFARQFGNVGAGVTNLVVIPDLERPGGERVFGPGASLAGLSISPPLLAEFAREMSEEGAVWQTVDLAPDFTPMMVLGDKIIRSLIRNDVVLKDLVVAHEFGHSAGLVHSAVELNLMFPSALIGRDHCTNGLDDGQLATMHMNLGLGGAADAGARSTTSPLTLQPPAAAAPSAARRRFLPADLRALLAGDRRPLRTLLRPLLH